MKYNYPMLTGTEINRKFIIDAVDMLHGKESLLKEHGFDIEGESVREYLFNMAADINDIDELDELVLDVTDILTDSGKTIVFLDKGYIIK